VHSDIYDVVIVGAGSAGCALAGRLATRTNLRIALVEAGPDFGPREAGGWPSELVDAHHSPDTHDWGWAQSRARVVGGCSAHNEAAIVRALPGDYDRWGIPGWTDADLAPLVGEIAGALPAFVCDTAELTAWQRAFLEAAVASGFPRLPHANAATGDEGVAPFVQNISAGVRWNAAFAFLDAARPRLTVVGDVLADRLEVEGDHARALIAHGLSGARTLHAGRFVLCAGVYGSPAVLLRSGVGPADALDKLGIRVQRDLPGVGANLHDHPGVAVEYEPTTRARRALRDDVRGGRFYEVQVVAKTAPELHVLPYQTALGRGRFSFGVIAFHLEPHSRGRMRLTRRDADAPPAIELGLLTDADGHDANALLHGLRCIHSLAARAPLARAIARGPRPFSSDARLARYVRDNVSDYGHSVGTCRMGPSPSGGDVVDGHARVHGLANVFVADASIVPRIPRANTNLTCSVIGGRVAEFVPGS
jgi:choline dehydrogenase